MLTKEYQNQENFELLKICLLRGKLMALMSRELNHEALEDDFFLTGVLSSIDVIINDCMENILHSLALSKEVKDALLGKPGMIRTCLQCILDYERFEFDLAKEKLQSIGLTLERFMDLYMDGLAWLRTTDE
jgi:EAL and modified HD-GYP domain-containing signal transduction protein